MDEKQQASAFARDLGNLVDRYASEFDLSAASAVGVLSLQIRLIQDSQLKDVDEGEPS